MAVTPVEELAHVRAGTVSLVQEPPGEIDTVTVAGGSRTLERAREVLVPVLQRASTGEDWPSTAEWRSLLPAWFVEACVDDAELRDCVLDKWSLRAWTYWFQPGLRKWRWWDAKVEGNHLAVDLLVLQRPYLRGALEWLLKVAADWRE